MRSPPTLPPPIQKFGTCIKRAFQILVRQRRGGTLHCMSRLLVSILRWVSGIEELILNLQFCDYAPNDNKKLSRSQSQKFRVRDRR